MLQPLAIPNAYFWSQWQPEHELLANSYLLTTHTGNVVIDPLPLDESAQEAIAKLGGVATVAVTTPDHARESEAFAKRYGAKVVTNPEHLEQIAPGIEAIRLLDQKHEREFAVSIPAHSAVVVGDSVLGTPAGRLSMLSDEKYADVTKAALGLRRILRLNPKTILTGHGQSIFSGAYDALYTLLHARAGAAIHRINLDELDFRDERDEHNEQPEIYGIIDAEVGWVVGARTLGYRVSTIPPGHKFCPLHSHAREEELFFVLDGEPSVRTLTGTLRCRKGDFIALPTGESGSHQLINESGEPATVLLLARAEGTEACYYPDSDKLLVDTAVPFVRGRTSTMVKGSPDLDYFNGE